MLRVKVCRKKEILYVTAFDEKGILVKAKDAEKSNAYYCPECKDKLILKKSGKTGKGSKRPHFAHHSESPNCTPEGVLHKSFKLLLIEYIKQNIENKTPINITWECVYCKEKHQGNLLQYVFNAKEEHPMKKCIPDIALLSKDGNPFAVIEIIVTHKPEETALSYYKENNIVLIQIELNNEDDLEKVEAKISIPTSVDYCFNINCPNIKDFLFHRRALVFTKKCGTFHIMRSCIAETMHFFGQSRSNYLTADEIEFAKSNGVEFVNNKIICPKCKSMRIRYGPRRNFRF